MARTLRLLFAYEGRDIELVSGESVEMRSPPSDPLEPREDETGFWYELRDTRSRRLYRRTTQNPIRASAEVLTDDRDRPLARERLTSMSGHFVLLAPDLEQATAIVLVGVPPEVEPGVQPVEELASFELGRIRGERT
jgi:hypothetical protein